MRAWVAALGFLLTVGPPVRAEQDAGSPRARMTCEHSSAPGRVQCEVEARVDAGESIAWGEVVLVRLPPFASALRGRMGPHDAVARETDLWRWPFAVVARETGSGELEGRVRLVVCREKTCATREVAVAGVVEVGPKVN